MNVGAFVVEARGRGVLILAFAILIVLTVVAMASRPIMPIDETRYIGVAWEMWLRGDFLVPFKNGAPYSHKPPLMMWLFQAGWAVFGVNEWWPRLVSPLVSFGNVLLTLALARRLWPDRANVGDHAVLILASCLLWTAFSTMVMFDIILAFFTLVGLHGTLSAAHGKTGRGITLLGVATGLGILAKGPVILLHVLPVALLAPWWNPVVRKSRWFAGVVAAILIGAALALCWAIPAGFSGGDEYRRAIFWGQTANRMVESFAHRHAAWWYLPHLPLMFFPWFVWPGLWRAVSRFVRQNLDGGGRFCLAWILPVIIIFSFISGKQMQYLLPIFPAFALLAARSVEDEERVAGLWMPVLAALAVGVALLVMGRKGSLADAIPGVLAVWPVGLLMLAVVATYWLGRRHSKPVTPLALLGIAIPVCVQLAFIRPLYSSYDVRPMATAIRQAQDSGRQVAHDGTYHNQYQFAGRLQVPLVEIDSTEILKTWLAGHPDAYAVVYAKDIRRFQAIKTIASQRYRGHAVALVDAPSALSLLETPTGDSVRQDTEQE